MPVTLPSDTAERHQLGPSETSAYNVCLEFEEHAKHNGPSDDLMKARILGYLIIYSPSATARHEVVKVIHSCNNDYASLSALGTTFLVYYIRPFKTLRGRTPSGSSLSSPPTFDKTKEEQLARIKEAAPKDYIAAKNQALLRDGNRCVVSGKYDWSAQYITVTEKELSAAGGGVYTECAHIVPDSTYFNMSVNSPDKRDYSASVLAVLHRFGLYFDKLNGERVHSLFNVMTMQMDAHDLFDRLELWFERTATPNCYNVRMTPDRRILSYPDVVTFTTPDPVGLPLPSPDLLAKLCMKLVLRLPICPGQVNTSIELLKKWKE